MLWAPQDGGHAEVATGRGVLSLRSYVVKALTPFFLMVAVLPVSRSGCFLFRFIFAFLLCAAVFFRVFCHIDALLKIHFPPLLLCYGENVFKKETFSSAILFIDPGIDGIDFPAKNDDNAGYVKPDHKHDNGPNASICRGKIAEAADIV